MKARKNKDIIAFIVLIPVFLYLAFLISTKLSGKLPQYSVINRSKTGYSVIYEALRKLNYRCYRVLEPVEQQNTTEFQIVADPDGSFDINDSSIKAWVNKGGKLLYMSPLNILKPEYGKFSDKEASVITYTYGKGSIILADSNYFMNRTLVKNKKNAYELLKVIDSQRADRLNFNENHLFAKAQARELWDFIPLEARFIIYQFLLVAIAFFYYKGKRFGKPIPFYEEVERDQNEYLYAAAALYKQANCWDIMIQNYYKNFLDNVKGDKQNWLNIWQQKNLPQLKKAVKLKDFMDKEQKHVKKKEYIEIVSILEELTEILKKRRESYWKTVKKLS